MWLHLAETLVSLVQSFLHFLRANLKRHAFLISSLFNVCLTELRRQLVAHIGIRSVGCVSDHYGIIEHRAKQESQRLIANVWALNVRLLDCSRTTFSDTAQKLFGTWRKP